MTVFRILFAPLLMLAAAARRAHRRYGARQAIIPLLQFDERMLRDIGLSRSDVIACLSAPDPEAMFEERARGHAETIAHVSASVVRRAA